MKKANVLSIVSLACLTACADVVFEAGNVDVVVAPRAVDSVQWAADEATNFLSRVLGSPVPVVAAPREGRTALVLGVNEWSKGAGLDPAKHPYDTYLIKTAPGMVFVAGVDEKGDVYRRLKRGNTLECFQRGTAMGLYAFLERFAGCRFYFPGELGEVVPRQKRFVVPETDIASTPDNLIRKCYMSDGELEPEMSVAAGYNPKVLNWMRLRLATTQLVCCHGTEKIDFMGRFSKTHPEYFAMTRDGARLNVPGASRSSKRGQLCFSHPGVREVVYQDCLQKFRKGADHVDIMPNDGYPGCFCEQCRKAARPDRGVYGRDTPIIWDFTADIARRLKAAGVKGRVTQMAYSSYSDVPDIDLPDNIAVMVATRGPWALVDKATMDGDLKKVRDWGKKTGGSVWIWTYPHKYKETMILGVPDVAPKAWGNYYKAMKGLIFGTFAESESDRTIYHYLNYYVFSRVMWDMDTDVDAVLDEHYSLMFGPGADDMKRFFDTLEDCWVGRVTGNLRETPLGPACVKPSPSDLWADIYAPAVMERLDGFLSAAYGKVPAGSLEARRVALMRRHIYEPLAKRPAKFAAENSVEDELARRRSRTVKSMLRNGDFSSLDGWTGESLENGSIAIATDQFVSPPSSLKITVTAKPKSRRGTRCVYATQMPDKLAEKLKPNTKYRISYFIKCDNLDKYLMNGGLYIQWWDSRYRWVPMTVPLAGNTGWMHQCYEMSTPEKFDDSKPHSVQIFITGCVGSAYIDDLLIEELP